MVTAPRRRRLVRAALVAIALALVVVTLGTGSPAWAHASLDSSSPGAFAVLETPPEELRLTFTETPQPGLGTLRLFDQQADEVDVGPLTPVPGDPTSSTAAVDPLPDGLYVVTWSVVSADGHRVNGSFAFSVGAASADAARDLLARVAADTDATDPVLDVAVAIARALGFVGLALMAGGLWLRAAPGVGTPVHSRLAAMTWVGWAWSATAAVVLLPLLGAQVTGGTLGDVGEVTRWGQLLEARQGQALLARWAVLAVVAAAVARLRWPDSDRRRIAVVSALGVALASTHTVAGHAATADVSWLAVLVTALHLVAVTAWMGVVGGVALTWGRWPDGARAAVLAGAPRARLAAPVAVAAGVAATLLVGPPMGDLLDTSWGRWLLVKVGVVVVALAIGTWIGRTAMSGTRPVPMRLLLAEASLGVVALVVAAGLVSTPPTQPVTIEPVTSTLVQAGVLAEVTITPARVGVNELHVVMSPPGGSLQPVGRVTARLVADGRDVPPFALDVAVAGVNHWTAPVQFPYPGAWTLELVAEVRPLELVQYRLSFDISG